MERLAWYGQRNLYGEGARQGDPHWGTQDSRDGEEVSDVSEVKGREPDVVFQG